MARTLYPKHGGFQFYSVAEWSLADNDAQNQTKPVAGDTILLTNSSAQVLCNEAWAAASLSHLGAGASEWQFSAQTAVVSGGITLDKVTATIEAADITAANLDLGTGGTLTLAGDQKITAAILIDGGILNLVTHKLTLSPGSTFSHTGGTFTSSGDWQATMDVNGATLSNVTATNKTRVYHGKDGGGNTKLFFVRPHGPLGRGGITRGLA